MKSKNVTEGMLVVIKNLPAKTSDYNGQKGTVQFPHSFEPDLWVVMLPCSTWIMLNAKNLKRVKP